MPRNQTYLYLGTTFVGLATLVGIAVSVILYQRIPNQTFEQLSSVYVVTQVLVGLMTALCGGGLLFLVTFIPLYGEERQRSAEIFPPDQNP